MTNYGVPSSTAVFSTSDRSLIAGNEIAIAYEDLTVAPDQDLAALTVVSLNEDDQLVPATLGAPAVGVLALPVRTAAGQTVTANTIRAGVLNPEALVFDDSFVTMADKVAAFRGAPAPTNIIVKRAF